MRKKLSVIVLAITLFSMFLTVLPVQAVDSYAYYRAFTDNDVNMGEAPLAGVHPAIGALRSGYGVQFNSSANGYLKTVTLVLLNCPNYVTSGNLECKLYGVSGVFGTNSYLNTTVLATSTGYAPIEALKRGVAWNALGANATDGTVNFSFDETYYLEAGVVYGVGVTVHDAVGIDGSHLIGIGQCAFDSDNPTYHSEFVTGGWDWDGETGLGLEVVVSSTSGTPSAPASLGDWGTADELITGFANFVVPLAFMLLPAILLIIFVGKDKWLILIGLAIGTGLAYYFVPGFPVWLVFLVAIGLIGLAYSEVRRNG